MYLLVIYLHLHSYLIMVLCSQEQFLFTILFKSNTYPFYSYLYTHFRLRVNIFKNFLVQILYPEHKFLNMFPISILLLNVFSLYL